MKNQKGFIPVIIILVILIGFVGVYYLGTLKPKTVTNNPTSTPIVSTLPSSVATSKPATPDPTANWKTYVSETLPLTFKYPSNIKTQEVYDLGSTYELYVSSNEIKMPPPPDGTFTALQVTYLNQYVNTYDKAIENAKGFFSTNSLNNTALSANGVKGMLYSGMGVDYWEGRKLSIAVFDRPLAPVIFYFYGDEKDPQFTESLFNQIVSTVKFIK